MRNKILYHLDAIIESGSLVGACRRLFLSQPALTQYVKRLEKEYEISIFDRTVSPWKLTDEGRFFIETQRKIESLDNECRQYFADRRQLKTGHVKIGSTAYRSSTLLNPVLSTFRSLYPQVSLKIEEGTTQEIIELVEAGRVDCSVVISSMVPNTQSSIKIYSEKVLIGLSKNHPFSRLHPETQQDNARGLFPRLNLYELKETPFIIMKKGQKFNEYFYTLCAKYGLPFSVALETQSILTVPNLVVADVGAALIPSTIASDCIKEGIHLFSVGEDLPSNDVSISWKKDRYQSYAVKEFLKLVKSEFKI